MSESRHAWLPPSAGRWAVWSLFAVVLAVAPLLFDSHLAVTLLSQMGIAIIACLSYNILFGQGGMLSFGHAVYSGLGAYMAIHALNAAARGVWPIPVSAIPLVGGLSGLFFALLFGYVTTRKAGTPFAMITLGLAELVFAMSLMFSDFFGGEAGVSGNRVVGEPFMGLSFGPPIQVYGLIAVYTFVCVALMFAFTCTPLGRMLNAVRDNPERVGFIGYNAQAVRYRAFLIAGFFAGVAGGLGALQFEIVTAEVVGAARSGSYLLFTFLGGATVFFGPIIGGVLMVLASVLLSELTKAWLLYLGLLFLFMVMYAPGGLASLIVMNLRLASCGRLREIWPAYLALGATALLVLLGAGSMVEMTYHLKLDASMGDAVTVLGVALDTRSATSWFGAVFVTLTGVGLFELTRRPFGRHWAAIQTGIETETRRGEWPQRLRAAPQAPSPPAPGAEGGPVRAVAAAVPALELRRLCKRFGKTEIVRGVDLVVLPGERVAIIGPNGAGKSTLFNLISGRFTPSSGEVLLHGARIDGKKPFEIHRLGLSRSFQITHIFPRLSVFENLRCSVLWSLGYRYTLFRFLARLTDANDRAEALMKMIHLDHKRDTLAMHLTYAEQRALEIGITIGGGASVILLDEPTAGMSQSETRRFIDLIRAVTAGKTLLAVEHDMGVVFGLADKIAVVVHGEVIAFDTPEAVRANPKVREAYLGFAPAEEPAAPHGH